MQIWNAHMGGKIQMLHYKSETVANVANSDILKSEEKNC